MFCLSFYPKPFPLIIVWLLNHINSGSNGSSVVIKWYQIMGKLIDNSAIQTWNRWEKCTDHWSEEKGKERDRHQREGKLEERKKCHTTDKRNESISSQFICINVTLFLSKLSSLFVHVSLLKETWQFTECMHKEWHEFAYYHAHIFWILEMRSYLHADFCLCLCYYHNISTIDTGIH